MSDKETIFHLGTEIFNMKLAQHALIKTIQTTGKALQDVIAVKGSPPYQVARTIAQKAIDDCKDLLDDLPKNI